MRAINSKQISEAQTIKTDRVADFSTLKDLARSMMNNRIRDFERDMEIKIFNNKEGDRKRCDLAAIVFEEIIVKGNQELNQAALQVFLEDYPKESIPYLKEWKEIARDPEAYKKKLQRQTEYRAKHPLKNKHEITQEYIDDILSEPQGEIDESIKDLDTLLKLVRSGKF